MNSGSIYHAKEQAMRRYDDPVEVRKGWIDGQQGGVEGPDQFLWRGRLWKVREVVAHWVETGPWWTASGAQAVIGANDVASTPTGVLAPDLLDEREFWRVEAGQPHTHSSDFAGGGVFDLAFDWSDGTWQLVGCVD
jgi:Family of unknown function (DUF6504)